MTPETGLWIGSNTVFAIRAFQILVGLQTSNLGTSDLPRKTDQEVLVAQREEVQQEGILKAMVVIRTLVAAAAVAVAE